jgi:hypothetical protein
MTNQINYFDKYIKYKTKYSELKETIGGAKKNFFIVATHSYRLQCILNGFRIHSMQSSVGYIKRFKNCAIVRIFRKDNGNTCVQLVFAGIYKGEFNSSTGKYISYIDERDDSHYETPDEKTFSLEINTKIPENKQYLIPKDVEIYLIRHGEGEHNVASKEDKKTLVDAKLTQDGHTQAQQSAIILNEYFNSRQLKNVNYIFYASDLHRTRQTIGNIKHILNINGKGDIKKNSIYVISCIHEITPITHPDRAADHQCDQNPQNKSAYNLPKCTTLTQTNDMCNSVSIIFNGITYKIPIDWSKYSINRDDATMNTRCASKNIIQQILMN